jgi:hypothetical protein
MGGNLKVVGSAAVHESWGPALKESGLEYVSLQSPDEAFNTKADFFLVDTSQREWVEALPRLKLSTTAPILTLVKSSVGLDELVKLRSNGAEGYLSDNTPPEEVVVRIHAMLGDLPKEKRDYRSARRVWFQQEVRFAVFKQEHRAWSTTLSETGIFLRTHLNFPLYTVIHLKFDLLGGKRTFECDGVIVRQEAEGDIRGFGVMFQNLKGENIRTLEEFLEVYR